MPPETVVEALGKDKKRKGNRIGFILLERLGVAIVDEIPIDELKHVPEWWGLCG